MVQDHAQWRHLEDLPGRSPQGCRPVQGQGRRQAHPKLVAGKVHEVLHRGVIHWEDFGPPIMPLGQVKTYKPDRLFVCQEHVK
ncbi:hypothetical protein D3C85_1830400 [compost metagenome]